MKKYQVRVIEECEDLSSKIVKLEEFLAGAGKKLKFREKLLMSKQLAAMNIYCKILKKRINRFE